MHYIPINNSLYKKEFVPLVILYPLSPLPTIFLWKPPICIICEFGICLLVCLFLAFTYKWDHTLFLCSTYFTYHNTIKVRACCHKWQRFLSFLWLYNIPLWGVCVCVCVCVCGVYPIFFSHSFFDRHLSYFHVLSTIKNDVANMGVHITFQVFVFVSFGQLPSFLKNLHSVFYDGCTKFHSHQQCKKVVLFCFVFLHIPSKTSLLSF